MTAQINAAKQRRRTMTRLAGKRQLALLGATAGVACMSHDVSANITFATPSNIAGDSDVLNVGATLYAYDWGNSTTTVNGVTFAGTTGTTSVVTGNATNLTLSLASGVNANNTTVYSNGGNPFNSLSAAYKSILVGGDNSPSNGDLETITLQNLLNGHLYATQFWVSDPRTNGAGRSETITSGNTQTLLYSVTSTAGSPGQFAIGSFTADATGTQAFTLTGSKVSQNNALQVRDVTGVWSGAINSTWDGATANFAGGNSFNTVSGLVNGVYFADTDGLGNAVTNGNLTIQSGGVSIGSVIFQNSAVNYAVTSSDANGIAGSASLIKSGAGSLTLSGTNSYTGGMTLNGGITQFNAGALPASGNVTINAGGTLNATGAFGNVASWLASNRIVASSSGTIALTGDSSQNIDFTGFGSLMLGATSNSNFSGTLTPAAGGFYRLGGGGATLTVSGTNALSGANGLVVGAAGSSGAIVLAAANSYSGGTTISAGSLTVGPAGTLGGNTTGNNVLLSAGANLSLGASSNIGSNQTISISSTTSSLGGIGVGYTPGSISALNINTTGTGVNGGIFGINYTGNAGISSLSTLETALNAGGGTGHWYLGSQSTGTFNGSSLSPATDNVYRLGGGGGSLTISGTVLTGNASVQIGSTSSNGAGTVALSAAQNFTGGTTINAGILKINSDSALGNVPGSPATNLTFSANAALQAGAPTVSLSGNRGIAISNAATATLDSNGNVLNVGGVISGTAGSLNIRGSGTVNLTGNSTFTGATTISSGALTYSGAGAYSGAGSLAVASTTGVGVLNANSSGTLSFAGPIIIGGGTGAGAVNQSSGTVSLLPAGNYVDIGAGGYGSYNLSGGTLNTPSNTGIKVGYAGMGVFTQSGGTLNSSRYFIVGTQGTGGNGVATFTGGAASVSGSNFYFIVGDAADASGAMNIGTQAGGNATVATSTNANGIQLTDSLETSGSGALNLNSGTLTINGGSINRLGNGTSKGILNFNGGKLQAGAANLTLIDNTPTSVNIYNGGAVIDTQANNATISANLLAPTGNGIYIPTTGTLAISSGGGSGYVGAPIVAVSDSTTPTATGAMAVANVSNGVVTGVTLTNPGQGYLAGDQLTFSFAGGGAATAATSYNYTLQGPGADLAANGAGGLTKIGNGTLTLSSANLYHGATTVSAGTLALSTASTNNIAGSKAITVASGATLELTGVSGTGGFALASGQALGGVGTVNGNTTVSSNSTISAGTSISLGTGSTNATGKLTTQNGSSTTAGQTWANGGAYAVKINETNGTSSGVNTGTAGGSAGGSTGWDQIAMNALLLSGLGNGAGNTFTITLSSPAAQSTSNAPIADFDNTKNYTWTIATITTGTPFTANTYLATANSLGASTSSALFSLDTSAFAGANPSLGSDSSFYLEALSNGAGGETLEIGYNATPEPDTALLLAAGTAPMLMRRRRGKRA